MYHNTFCDNCGCGISNGTAVVYPSLPVDLASVNAGESAVICKDCDSELETNYPIDRSSSRTP